MISARESTPTIARLFTGAEVVLTTTRPGSIRLTSRKLTVQEVRFDEDQHELVLRLLSPHQHAREVRIQRILGSLSDGSGFYGETAEGEHLSLLTTRTPAAPPTFRRRTAGQIMREAAALLPN